MKKFIILLTMITVFPISANAKITVGESIFITEPKTPVPVLIGEKQLNFFNGEGEMLFGFYSAKRIKVTEEMKRAAFTLMTRSFPIIECDPFHCWDINDPKTFIAFEEE